MPLDITFTLSDRDLARFKTLAQAACAQTAQPQSQKAIEAATRKIVETAINADLPDFIAGRLMELKVLLDMMQDTEWGMTDADRNRIIGALAYFADPADLIPDHIPGIGFLDDAMFVEIVIRELAAEIQAYNEFCKFRSQSGIAQSSPEDRDRQLQGKRQELHARLAASRPTGDEFTFHIL
ncbi:MAG: YkvA family protein [Gammaproteobacteria bacterium]